MLIQFNLKKAIHERGLTYEQFGNKFSPPIERSQVSRLTRANGVTWEKLAQICQALNISKNELTDLIKIYEEKQ